MNTRRDYERALRLVARYRRLIRQIDTRGLARVRQTMWLLLKRNDRLRALGYLLDEKGRVLSTRRYRIDVSTKNQRVRVRVVRR